MKYRVKPKVYSGKLIRNTAKLFPPNIRVSCYKITELFTERIQNAEPKLVFIIS